MLRSVAFSPDGSILATAGDNFMVRLWDADTGDAVGEPLIGDPTWVSSVAFAPDGSLLASANSDGTVRVWDPGTGNPVGNALVGHDDLVSSVAFSPDGHVARLRRRGRDGAVVGCRHWRSDRRTADRTRRLE